MRYFIHPESCCAWKIDGPVPVYVDPLVEEVSEEEYLKACAAWGEEPNEAFGE
jgi:hypothetical protein